MAKFGRKFFFDKVYTKKNYTLAIIIVSILVVAIIATFLITRYYKADKPAEAKVTFKKSIKIEVYSELPSIEDYIKKMENIKTEDLEIVYPETLATEEDLSNCENAENTESCKKVLASTVGEYEIVFKSEKLKKDKTVTLKVVDTIAPLLEVKELTITEGNTYAVTDFVSACTDNSKLDCSYKFADAKDEDENVIDYSKYTNPGEYEIKVIAKDESGNISEEKATKLIINKKVEKPNKEEQKPSKEPEKEDNKKPETKTCKYGDLTYSNTYVIATKVNSTECAISPEEAGDLANKAVTVHNKKIVKEIQEEYLKNTIDAMYLEGIITYDIVYGPVYNTTNKGVVGYFIMSEATQTINGVTTTIARYFIDENGNRVWKVNALNLK